MSDEARRMEFISKAREYSRSRFVKADETLKKDREFILQAVQKSGSSLKYVDQLFKKDREIVLGAVKKSGSSLKYADETMKKDREIVLEAVKQNGYSLKYADEILKNNREFILQAVQKSGSSLKYAVKMFKKDREIVLQAVKNSGWSLEYADETLKKNGEFILEAVKRNGSSLEFAAEMFKKDRDFVLKAVKQNGDSFEYADEIFKKDRDFVLKAVKQNGSSLKYAYEIFKKDREIVLQAVKQNGSSLEFADETLKKDREFILEAVKQNGSSLKYADEIFKKDREMILLAVKHGYLLEPVDYSRFKKEIKIIESLPNVYLNTKTSKYEFLKIVDTSSINQQLSKDIIEYYNKKFCEENDLFYQIYFELFPIPITKSNLINLNSNYSPQFIEKLIILQILQSISAINPSANSHTSKTIDYYLFCFKLDKFFEEQQDYLKPTSFLNIKGIVNFISSKFEINYSEKEVAFILHFYSAWTFDVETFNNHKELIQTYNECNSDYLKIFRALKGYYNYLKKHNYDIISVLGYGAEGVVFKAFDKNLKEYVALKISFDYIDNSTAQERIKFLKIDIEGKIKCYDANLMDNYLYSIMEMGEETLFEFIKRNSENYKGNSLSRGYVIEILEIYSKILGSVQSIHDFNIIHRDLDPRNIVKIGDKYKIIDFDIAKVAKAGKSITLNRGKYPYMSPEVSQDSYIEELLDDDKLVENVGNISTLSDVFSMGCILLKLLTNGSLMLDKKFLLDANITDYNDFYRYFVWDGVYFHSVLIDSMREKKLHHAIQKTIDQYIDSNFGVNNILTRCLITMIQQDPKKRLTCYQHRAILLKVINYLKDGSSNISEIEKEIDNLYTEISPLKEIPQIIEENDELKKEIKELKKGNSEFKSQVADKDVIIKEKDLKIKELEEEIRKLKLQLEIKQHSELY